MKKLCVCGRSEKLPYCDNSHVSEDWNCSEAQDWSHFAFCASVRYQNLSLKLASHYGGILADGAQACEVLVIVIDGSDLERPSLRAAKVERKRTVVVGFGLDSSILRLAFPDCEHLDLSALEPVAGFRQICRFLDSESSSKAQESRKPLSSGFLSHAVIDEPEILPAVEYARTYFKSKLFLCADSIRPGQNWKDVILSELKNKDVFVLVLSQAAASSTFCSFEVGVAVALSKPVHIFSLDGTLPPAYAGEIQTIDIPRLQRQRPWLSLQDVLIQQLLKALAPDAHR